MPRPFWRAVCYFLRSRCDSVLAAADFALALALGLRRTFDAAVAAFADETLLGAAVCESALAAALLALADEEVDSVADACFAADLPVVFLLIEELQSVGDREERTQPEGPRSKGLYQIYSLRLIEARQHCYNDTLNREISIKHDWFVAKIRGARQEQRSV